MPSKRILILGGGFGGAYAAMYLERRLGRRDDIEIALVCRENYLVFQPLMPELLSASLGIVDTIAPLRRLCPRTQLYTRDVEAIDLDARTARRVELGVQAEIEQRELELAHGGEAGLESARA